MTVDNIYNVAGFISKYSDDAPVEYIMCLLRKNAVETNYEIKEGEGK